MNNRPESKPTTLRNDFTPESTNDPREEVKQEIEEAKERDEEAEGI